MTDATNAPSPAGSGYDEMDADSAYGSGSSVMTETASLISSIHTKYREENGRTYHAWGSTDHWGPNDEEAKDQQDLSHHVWTTVLEGKLYIAPVINPQRIYDLGTGTGIWVMDVAEQNPQADVKGIDLSPIQPLYVPQNARFEIDDYNLEWLDEAKFDLVHQRELLGTTKDWPAFYRRCFISLKPGGWVDIAEPSIYFHSKLDVADPVPVYNKWGEVMREAGLKAGMRFDIAESLKGWLEDAGFVNVIERKVPVTIGRWSKDPKQREIGIWNQARLERGISDFSMRRLTSQLEWSSNEVDEFCEQLRVAFRNPRLLGYQWFYFVAGQRPLN